MSASNALENGLLDLIFFGTTFAGIAENDSGTPATSFYVSLHTADPGEGGSQNTSETTYTGYARIEVTRDASGWTRTDNSVGNDEEISFGQCTAGAQTITHVGLGTDATGAGTLLLSNELDSTLVLAVGATPRFGVGELTFTCD